MSRVLEDVRRDTLAAERNDGVDGKNGVNGANGKGKGVGKGENGRGNGGKEGSLALPKSVVEEGVKVTRECLELVCELEQ
jgi:hypothetical protein